MKSWSREVVKLWSRKLWVMSYELWVMSYECGVKSWSWWVVKTWSWNILLYEEILHYAVLRSEWQGYVFCSRLRICFSGGIFFESQRFFFLNYFLSELSWRNSFAMKRCGEGWRMKDEGWGMRDAGWGMRVFYHKVHGDMVKWLRFWRLWGTSEMFWKGHGFSIGKCRKIFSFMKRFFTMLRFVQNDRVMFFAHD